jgi:plasmid stabilization system protein ParE
MEITWRPEARDMLRAIYLFYAGKSARVADKIVNTILKSVDKLAAFPAMAPVEERLAGLDEEFRSLVAHKLFKVVYYIDESAGEIVIVAIHDCRRDPAKLGRGISE